MKTPAALSVVSLRVRAFPQRTKSPTLLAIIAMLCAYGSAATGSLYTSGLNVPVGLLWLGSTETASGIRHGHVWAADAGGFCRIDDDGNGNAALTSTCAPGLPGAVTGQPDWDPSTNNVYIPTAAGIARYTFHPSVADPTQETLTGPTANLGQPSATGVAFGPDAKLYFGFVKDDTVHRMTTPAGASQTLESVGVTSPIHPGGAAGPGILGLAFQGGDLFINATNDLQRIGSATLYCNGACAAEDLNITVVAVGSNTANLAFFAPQGGSLAPNQASEIIDEYDTVTGNTYQLSRSGQTCSVAWFAYTCPAQSTSTIFYAAVIAITMDRYTQAVYVVDDTSAGVTPNSGRVIRLAPAGPSQPPTPDGPEPFIHPITRSQPPSIPAHSATLLANSGLTAPGVLTIGTDVWALDAIAGICRVDNGRLNLSTCVVLGGTPGQSSYDPATRSVYVPDKSANSRGVWRVPYNPASRTLNGSGAALVAANKGLGGNQPLCAVIGPDGSLYVSFNKNGNVLRITAPTTTTNTITQVASSTDGKAVRSLAWISKTVDDGFGNPLIQNSLYMLQTAALTFVTTADTGVKSRTAFGTPMQITNPAAIVSDGSDTIYVAEGSEIDTYTVSTKASVQYSVGSIGPPLTFFGKITGLALSGATVYVGDDATGASAAGQGRIWTD